MASVQEIRQRLRGQRIETLRSRIEPLLAGAAAGRGSLVAGHLPRCDPSAANPAAMTGRLHAWLPQAT